jgi:hypothetical protein
MSSGKTGFSFFHKEYLISISAVPYFLIPKLSDITLKSVPSYWQSGNTTTVLCTGYTTLKEWYDKSATAKMLNIPPRVCLCFLQFSFTQYLEPASQKIPLNLGNTKNRE